MSHINLNLCIYSMSYVKSKTSSWVDWIRYLSAYLKRQSTYLFRYNVNVLFFLMSWSDRELNVSEWYQQNYSIIYRIFYLSLTQNNTSRWSIWLVYIEGQSIFYWKNFKYYFKRALLKKSYLENKYKSMWLG